MEIFRVVIQFEDFFKQMGYGCYDDYLIFFGIRIEGYIWYLISTTSIGEGDDYAVNEGRSTDKIKVLNAEAKSVSAAGETLNTTTLAVSTARSRMKKMSKRQKTDADFEEEEQLRVFLNIIPDEEREVDYAVLDKSSPCLTDIKNWLVQKKTTLDGLDLSRLAITLNRLARSIHKGIHRVVFEYHRSIPCDHSSSIYTTSLHKS
nr:hypothetical protein [Tanacetum cinerariifolium]